MKYGEAMAYRRKIETAASLQTDEQALDSIELFPKWKAGMDVHTGERYKYDHRLWKVLLDHKTQEDWLPTISPSLFVEVTVDEWPEWKRPSGSTDAYNTGDKVTFEGEHYISLIDGNVWSPAETPQYWEKQ